MSNREVNMHSEAIQNTHFVQYDHLNLADFGYSFFDEIQHSSRSCYNNMHCRGEIIRQFIISLDAGCYRVNQFRKKGPVYVIHTGLIEPHDVITEVGPPGGCHHLNPTHVFANLDADLAHLQSQFSGGDNDQC